MVEYENIGTRNTLSLILLVICAIIFVFILCAKIIIPFSNKKDYITKRIRSTQGREQEYWKRKLKRHYVRQIPLLGNIIIRHCKKLH